MIYIKGNEYNIINNYNDKVKMILRSRLEANIKYVVTTLYSALYVRRYDHMQGVGLKDLSRGFVRMLVI